MTIYHVKTLAGEKKYHEPIGAVIYAKSHLLREVKDVVAHPNDGATIEHPKPSGKPGVVRYVYTASDGKWHYATDVGKDGQPEPGSSGKTPEDMPGLLDKFSEAHPEVRYTVKQGVKLPGSGKAKEAPPDMGPDLQKAAEALKPVTYSSAIQDITDAKPGATLVTTDGSGTYVKKADGTWKADWGNISPELLADNMVGGSVKWGEPTDVPPQDAYFPLSKFAEAPVGTTFPSEAGQAWKKTAPNKWENGVLGVSQTDAGMAETKGYFGPVVVGPQPGDAYITDVPAKMDDLPTGSLVEWSHLHGDGPGIVYAKSADGKWAPIGQHLPPGIHGQPFPSSAFDPNVGGVPVMQAIVRQVGTRTAKDVLAKPEVGDVLHTDTGATWTYTGEKGKEWHSNAGTTMAHEDFAATGVTVHLGPATLKDSKPVLSATHVADTPKPTHKVAPEEIPFDVEVNTPLRDLKSEGDDKFPVLPNPDMTHSDEGDELAVKPLAKDDYSVRAYTGEGAGEINPGLRDGVSPDTYSDVAHIDDTMRGLKENVTLYRSIPPEAFHYDTYSGLLKDRKKLIGSVFNDQGYSSTSYRPEGPEGGALVMKIHAPKGIPAVDAEAVSSYHSEHEILLGRGMNYRITNIRKIKDRYGDPKTVIDVDAIGSPVYKHLKQTKAKPTHTLKNDKKPGEGVHQSLTPKGVPKIEKLKDAPAGTKLTDVLHTWTKTDHGTWVGPSENEMDSAGVAQAAGQVANDQGTVFHLEEPKPAHASEVHHGPTSKLVTATAIAKAAGIAPNHSNLGLIKALKGLHPAKTPEIVLTWAPLFKKAPVNAVTFDSNSPGIFYVKGADGGWLTMATGPKAQPLDALPNLSDEDLSKYAGGSGWRLFVP